MAIWGAGPALHSPPMAGTRLATPADGDLPAVPGPVEAVPAVPLPAARAVAWLAAGAVTLTVLGWAGQAADANRGPAGALLAQGEIGITLAMVLLGYAASFPFLRGGTAEVDAPPTWWAHSRVWLLRIVPGAWAVGLAAYLFPAASGAARPTGAFGLAPSGRTSVPWQALVRTLTFTEQFRWGGAVGPAGRLWPAAAAVAFILILPPVARAARGRPALLLATMAGVSVVLRLALLAADGSHSAGPVDALPLHLDAFAAGLAIAVLAAAPAGQAGGAAKAWAGRLILALTRPKAPLMGAAFAAAVLLVAAYGLGVGHRSSVPTNGAVVGQHLLFVVAAFGLAAPVIVRRAASASVRVPVAPPLVPTAAVIGVSYAFFLWAPIVLDRWVSASGRGDQAAATSRNPGALFHVGLPATILWTLVVTKLVAWVSWFAVQRPWLRYERRPMARFTLGLWLIALASFASRLWSFGGPTARNPGNGDPFYYHAQANMLADRVGFGEPIQWLTQHRFVATAIHPPLFTLWLTPSSLLGARGFLSHKVMAGFAGVIVVVVAGLLARRLAGDRAGLLAAALVALSPDLWIIDGTLWPEGLYTAVVGLALLAAYRWRDHPSFGRAAALGAAVGAAILTRGEAVLLLPLLCLPLAWSKRGDMTRWLRHIAVMGGVALLVLAPWTIRNLMTFDHVVPVSTNSEEVLYYANCPDVYHGPLIGWWSFNCQQEARAARVAKGLPADPPGDESARAAGWGRLGRQYALDHTDRWPAVAWARITRVWDLQRADNTARLLTFEGRPLRWSEDGLMAYRITLLPALAGLFILGRRRRQPVWPLLAMLAMVTVTAVSVYGHVRFRTVGDLVLLVAAAVTLDAVLPGDRRRTPAEPDPAANRA